MASTLKVKEDIRKRKLEEDMLKFLRELERVSENLDLSIGPIHVGLTLDTGRLGVKDGEDVTGSGNETDILELSARGILILRGLASISGEQELSNELNRLRLGTLGGYIGERDTPAGFWRKARNIFAGMFG